MDWRVDVKIDGVTRSFSYANESLARKVLVQLAKSMASGDGVVFPGNHVLNPRHIVSAQAVDYSTGGPLAAGEA
jgi:hypothetical protein